MPTLPYLTTPGNLKKAFDAIQMAATPERVPQDFVKTVLMIPGGSGDNMTTFLKRIGFAGSDGKPTEIYKSFRNSETAGQAVADAMKFAYSEIFKRNEYAYRLSDDEIKGHVIEITGSSAEARNVSLTVSTFANMKDYADFEGQKPSVPLVETDTVAAEETVGASSQAQLPHQQSKELGLNLGYTINLNLPASNDPAVFNAIFKSLKENLLNSDD